MLRMEFPRTRRVQRVHLAQPIAARFGTAEVVIVDLSLLGARIEHRTPLPAGRRATLAFKWEEQRVEIEVRVVRSRLERFSTGADGMTIYHSGIEIESASPQARAQLKAMIGRFIAEALEEQKLNARGALPQHHVDKMPIFRFGGQLTSNARDRELSGSPAYVSRRIAKETGYVCYQLEDNRWRRKRTHDPGQPSNGFTISADEDHTQADLLCEAYLRSDAEGRRMIQLCAQLSIVEGEGNGAGARAGSEAGAEP